MLSLKLTPEQLYAFQKGCCSSSSSSKSFLRHLCPPPLVSITSLELEVDFSQATMLKSNKNSTSSFADFRRQMTKEVKEVKKVVRQSPLHANSVCLSYILFCLEGLSSRGLFPNVRRLQLELYLHHHHNLLRLDEALQKLSGGGGGGENGEAIIEHVLRTSHFPFADSVRVFLI